MFPFTTTRSAETEYSLLSPSAKRKKMHLMKTSSDKSEHNSSIEDISVTEQDNLSTVCNDCYINEFSFLIDMLIYIMYYFF